jgi:hypothetical protein
MSRGNPESYFEAFMKAILEDEKTASIFLNFVTFFEERITFTSAGQQLINRLLEQARLQATEQELNELQMKIIGKKLILWSLLHLLTTYTPELGLLTFYPNHADEFVDNFTPFLDSDDPNVSYRYFITARLGDIPVMTLVKIAIEDIFKYQGTPIGYNEITDPEAFIYALSCLVSDDVNRLNLHYPLSQIARNRVAEKGLVFVREQLGLTDAEIDRSGVHRAERMEDVRLKYEKVLGRNKVRLTAGIPVPYSKLNGYTIEKINNFLRNLYNIEDDNFTFFKRANDGMVCLIDATIVGPEGRQELFQGVDLFFTPREPTREDRTKKNLNQKIIDRYQEFTKSLQGDSQDSDWSTGAIQGDNDTNNFIVDEDELNEELAEEEANPRMPLNEDDYLPALTIVNLKLQQKQFKEEVVPINVFPDAIQTIFKAAIITGNTINSIRKEAVLTALDTKEEAVEILRALIGATSEEKTAVMGVAKKVQELSTFITAAETDIDSTFITAAETDIDSIRQVSSREEDTPREEDSPREISIREDQKRNITRFAENIYDNIGRKNGATAYIQPNLDDMRRKGRAEYNKRNPVDNYFLDKRPNDLEEGEVYEGRRGGKVTRKHRRRHRKNKTKKVRRVRRTNKRRRRIIKRRKSHKKH